MPATFRFREAVDLWGVIRRGENDGPVTRQFHNWVLVARLKPGVSIEAAQQQVDVISRRLQQLYPATNKTKALRLDPLQAALFQPQTPRLMMLMGAVASGPARSRARMSPGCCWRAAPRGVRNSPCERLSARLAGASPVSCSSKASRWPSPRGLRAWPSRCGCSALLPIATGLAESGVDASGLEWRVLLFALLVSVMTGVVAGVVPAMRAWAASRGPPGAWCHDRQTRGEARGCGACSLSCRSPSSLFLLVGAGLLIRSFAKLTEVDAGLRRPPCVDRTDFSSLCAAGPVHPVLRRVAR